MNNKIDRREFVRHGIGAAGAASLLGGSVFGHETATGSKTDPLRSKLKLKPLGSDFLKRLPRIMALANVPGAAVAYVENGKITWHGDYGVMNASTREPVTADTVWQPASLGKPVFAYGVMKLVEAGKFDLDKPLTDYVPGEMIKDEPRVAQVTARRALSHTTGLQNWRFQAGDTLRLAFDPGARWQYSGEGIYYVQRAVEEVTGKGLEEFMQETVFRPLGMTSSSYYWRPDYEKRLVTMHDAAGNVAPDFISQNTPKVAAGAKKPVETWRHADQESYQAANEKRFPPFPTFFVINAAGTLKATIDDYAKIVAAVLSPLAKTGLSEKFVTEMLKPQIRINDYVSWGLGWGLQTTESSTCFWHWGEGTNYRTFVMGDRASGRGVVIFTNARNGRKIWERTLLESTGEDQPLTWWL